MCCSILPSGWRQKSQNVTTGCSVRHRFTVGNVCAVLASQPPQRVLRHQLVRPFPALALVDEKTVVFQKGSFSCVSLRTPCILCRVYPGVTCRPMRGNTSKEPVSTATLKQRVKAHRRVKVASSILRSILLAMLYSTILTSRPRTSTRRALGETVVSCVFRGGVGCSSPGHAWHASAHCAFM